MAKASLLAWLAWALPVHSAGTCLRCWPGAAEYFSYDAHLLLQDGEITDKLEKLFLESTEEDQANYGGRYLEQDHMEHEAGNLFLRLEQIIQKSGKDRELLMKEAEQEKQHFVKKLEEASKAFLDEICSLSCVKTRYKPYEVADCRSCTVFTAPCLAPIVCAGPNVVAAVLVTLLLIVLGIGAAVYYRYCKKKVKTQDGGEAREGGAYDKESSSESTETSEWSDDTIPSVSKYYNMPQAHDWNIPKAPHYENIPQAPHYENIPQAPNIPSPPELNIPSPPNLNIPSPPNLNIPSPPELNIPHLPADNNTED